MRDRKVKSRKRRIITRADASRAAARDVQDRDGAAGVIDDTKNSLPTLSLRYADGGYAGNKPGLEMLKTGGPAIETVRRADGAKGFVVIAGRGVAERTFARTGRRRRLAKDRETSIASIRHLARPYRKAKSKR